MAGLGKNVQPTKPSKHDSQVEKDHQKAWASPNTLDSGRQPKPDMVGIAQASASPCHGCASWSDTAVAFIPFRTSNMAASATMLPSSAPILHIGFACTALAIHVRSYSIGAPDIGVVRVEGAAFGSLSESRNSGPTGSMMGPGVSNSVSFAGRSR